MEDSQRSAPAFVSSFSLAARLVTSAGLGSFFAGIGLDFIRFPRSATPETVPPEAVMSLAILSGPVMFVLFAATVIISSRYPMTEERHREIMSQIRGELH